MYVICLYVYMYKYVHIYIYNNLLTVICFGTDRTRSVTIARALCQTRPTLLVILMWMLTREQVKMRTSQLPGGISFTAFKITLSIFCLCCLNVPVYAKIALCLLSCCILLILFPPSASFAMAVLVK